MTRVLVFPCSNGIGQEIYFALRYVKDVVLYGANEGSTNIGRFLYSNYIGDMPLTQDSIKEYLINVVRLYGIQYIIATSGAAQIAAHQAQTSAVVVASPLVTTGICQSKKAIYELCGKGGIRVPEIYKDIEAVEATGHFPVYVKPDKGGEQRRMFSLVNDKTALKRVPNSHIITEYLPGEEFTVDCLTDAHGKLLFYGARRRTLTHASVSILNETIDRSIFEAFTSRVNAQMRFIGAWFLQCIYDRHGQLCLIDVNPRIAGAMSIHRNLGVNFPLIALYTHMNRPVDILWMDIPAKCAKIYHNYLECPSLEYDTVCVDLDETLILQDGSVNYRLIGFLYKSINEGKRIYLITRHRGDVHETLSSKRIHAKIFDKIFQLPQGPNKGDYMPPRSILIDDSFKERKKVKDAHPNMYVFDVDALDMLINSCPKHFPIP